MLWQLVIPMAFVTLGLVVSKVHPGSSKNDPSRVLSIGNSAPSDNVALFYASFDDANFDINIGVSV